MTTCRRRPNEHGFTLVELGTVLAVMAVLMTAVMVGRGMLKSARTARAGELVLTLRKAARSCVERKAQASFAGCNLAQLQAYQLVPNPLPDPYTGAAMGAGTVTPDGTGAFVTITIAAPTPYQAEDLRARLDSANVGIAAAGGAPGSTVTVDVR